MICMLLKKNKNKSTEKGAEYRNKSMKAIYELKIDLKKY